MKTVLCALVVMTLLTACSDVRPGSVAAISCPVRMAPGPRPEGEGVITRLLPQEEAMALLSRTQKLVGRPIDSAYINNVRAIVRTGDGSFRTVLLPYGMAAGVGDRVAFQSASLSTPPPCNYVPSLATAKF